MDSAAPTHLFLFSLVLLSLVPVIRCRDAPNKLHDYHILVVKGRILCRGCSGKLDISIARAKVRLVCGQDCAFGVSNSHGEFSLEIGFKLAFPFHRKIICKLEVDRRSLPVTCNFPTSKMIHEFMATYRSSRITYEPFCLGYRPEVCSRPLLPPETIPHYYTPPRAPPEAPAIVLPPRSVPPPPPAMLDDSTKRRSHHHHHHHHHHHGDHRDFSPPPPSADELPAAPPAAPPSDSTDYPSP